MKKQKRLFTWVTLILKGHEMEKAERIVLVAQKMAFHNAARNGIMEWNVAAKLISKLEQEQEMREERSRDSEGGFE